MTLSRSKFLPTLLLGAMALAGCSAITPNQVPDNYSGEGGPNSESSRLIGSATGSDVILGTSKNKPADQGGGGGAGLGVNAYLWRGALDTLSFMPLASADPFGGVIITDWYANPEKPDERFKATVYILDTRLRADGVSVTVFKQVKDTAGGWTNAPVSGQTDVDVENAILTRARQLKLSTINVKG